MQTRVSQIDGKSIALDSQHQDRLIKRGKAKSIQKPSREKLRGITNRPKIDRGSLPGRPVAPKSIPGAISGRLGSLLGRLRRAPGAPKGVPGAQSQCPGAPWSAPRQPKSMPSRVGERKIMVFLAQLVREAFSEQFFDDFGSFFALTFVIFCGDIARASRLAARRANVAISLVFCS